MFRIGVHLSTVVEVANIMSMNKQQMVLVAVGLLGFAVVVAFALTQFAQQDVSSGENNQGRLPDAPSEETSEAEDELREDERVLVHFARAKEGETTVAPFQRPSDDPNDFLLAMEELVRGPEADELEEGYITELQFDQEDESVCDEQNFSIVAESGIFVVWLCRELVNETREESRERAFNQVDATMRQFEMVDDVVILDKERDCFAPEDDDENTCYEALPSGVSP